MFRRVLPHIELPHWLVFLLGVASTNLVAVGGYARGWLGGGLIVLGAVGVNAWHELAITRELVDLALQEEDEELHLHFRRDV